MIKLACFYFSLVVCSGCWLPIRGSADDDLRQIFLSASDFCRCANKPARDGRSLFDLSGQRNFAGCIAVLAGDGGNLWNTQGESVYRR